MTETLRVQHQFKATCERVYDAFVDPKKAGKFLFATPTGQMQRVEIDARVGGKLLFVDRRDGEDVEHVGKFLELARPTKLSFEFTVAKISPDSTRVTVAIVPVGSGCELTLTHEGVPTNAAQRSAHGWETILQTLEQVLETAD